MSIPVEESVAKVCFKPGHAMCQHISGTKMAKSSKDLTGSSKIFEIQNKDFSCHTDIGEDHEPGSVSSLRKEKKRNYNFD